ncbi:MAG: hypothetical protein ACREYB_13445 [Casimicrobiaceae bacterium]
MTALAVLGLAPAIGVACEYVDDSSASATPPARLALAPAPAASRVPASTVAKALAPNATKQAASKVKTPARDPKVAAATAD